MSKEYTRDELIFAHYKVIKTLAHGGMNSVIYLIEDLNIPIDKPNHQKILKVITRVKDMTNEE